VAAGGGASSDICRWGYVPVEYLEPGAVHDDMVDHRRMQKWTRQKRLLSRNILFRTDYSHVEAQT
jgi:hypothetical protein